MAKAKSKGSKSKKTASKGSKGSKGSKKSKGSKESVEPPVDDGMQTDPSSMCYICCRSFADHASVQAHLLLMNHFKPNSITEQKCRDCHMILSIKHVEGHKCCIRKGLYLRYISCNEMLKQGPPYRCLFCRSEPFSSRIDLTTHLMCFHRPGRQLGCCGQCKFTFTESLPKPSSIHPPPENADPIILEEYKRELIKESDKNLLTMELSEGIRELFKHIEEEHNNAFQFLAQTKMATHYELRMPFSCVICDQVLNSNVQFQTHIVARHGVDECIKYTHRICAQCNAGESNNDGFNIHARINHEHNLVHNAKVLIENEILMNATDCATTCCTCWKTFKTDFQLQAHVLQCHTNINPMVCGFCGEDYSTCTDPIFGFLAFMKHELNHGRELQVIAVEMKRCFDPIPEKVEDGFSPDIIEAYYRAKNEINDKSSKGRSKKGSKDKKEKKSKSNTKNKNKSPKKKK